MVPAQLIIDLKKELESILGHIKLPAAKEAESSFRIFSYGLPVERTKEDKKKKFPYVLILPMDGNIPGGVEAQRVKLELLIGIWDDAVENQGKQWVLNVINDIQERFSKDPILKGQYYAEKKIEWVMDTEDEHPYHYGAVWMEFNVPSFQREDEYA